MSRSVFVGYGRKLVLAFDIGTTFSGISYSILDHGQVPEIKGVTSHGTSKIPTVIYYDQQGNVRAVGAEATQECTFDIAQDEGWIKAEWFKLHLRPMTGASKLVGDKLPPLPLNKSIVDVFADFLKYLFQCASSYIKDTYADGKNLWWTLNRNVNFVLTHPNWWEGFQKSHMRQAAVLAGLIPDTKEGHACITFVTEGEAGLQFAIQNGLAVEDVKEGDGVVIVDAGGGTIDVSTYSKVAATGKKTFKEIAIPECHFHGSVFVSIHARVFLNNRLAESPFIDDLDHVVCCFDATTKLRFRSDTSPEYIKFGSTRDNDYAHGIRFGQMKLDGSDIREFFSPSVKCITEAVERQRRSAHGRVTRVVLVGGFADNDWLRNEIHRILKPLHLDIVRPENGVNRAVQDGAVFLYIKNFVPCHVPGTPYDCVILPFHVSNAPQYHPASPIITRISGRIVIPKHFGILMPSKTRVSEENLKEYRLRFHHESKSKIPYITMSISHYRGELTSPPWTDIKADMYENLYSVTADLSHDSMQTLQRKVIGKRGIYYQVDWEIILLLGLTELRIHYAWVEDGVEKRLPATTIYAPQIPKELS